MRPTKIEIALSLITIVLLTFILGFVVEISMVKADTAHCFKLQKQSTEYANFFISPSEYHTCEALEMSVDADIKDYEKTN